MPYFYPPSSARGLAGLIRIDDSDGLRHDTDVVGDGSAHVGLELLGNLTQSVPDAAQDFLLLFFGHLITSVLFSAKLLTGNFRVIVPFTWGWLPNTRIHNMGAPILSRFLLQRVLAVLNIYHNCV